MQTIQRQAVYDPALHLVACRFQGFDRPFPSHFHDYYVAGLVETGSRRLTCRGRTFAVRRGDVLLFNPGDAHACVQTGGEALDYRALHIPAPVLLDLTGALMGQRVLPRFSPGVLPDVGSEGRENIRRCLEALHQQVLTQGPGREEGLLLLASLLLETCPLPGEAPACREEVRWACAFMERHFDRPISLDLLCRHTGLSKATLLRAFTRERGLTPHRYLENIRAAQARRLLEQGLTPVEAALRTGFADQSHFTRSFSRFTGLTPARYRALFLDRPGAGGGTGPI